MTSTAKTRLYILLVAVLSPLFIISVIYFYSIKQYENQGINEIHENLQRFEQVRIAHLNEMKQAAIDLANSPDIKRALLFLESRQSNLAELNQLKTDFDILEIVDSSYRVLASDHRPGYIGETANHDFTKGEPDSVNYLESTEYDLNGYHATFGYFVPITRGYQLYASKYVSSNYINLIGQLLDADVQLYFSDDPNPRLSDYSHLTKNQLFRDKSGDTLSTLLSGNQNAGYLLLAKFSISNERTIFTSLLRMIVLAAVFSALLAVVAGVYITGQTKKEIDNLILATRQIADGDLVNPVIAYSEGEFSELADAFSEMKSKLRKTLDKLSTSEKIAAWREMGQKIAHEVKNPLTPIAVSVDDLRRSYYEKLPDFDKTIDETTTVIRIEVNRLIGLLDQFVKFARMEPPVKVDVDLKSITNDLERLYQHEIEARVLIIKNDCAGATYRLDPEKIKQLLINLIKNALEASPDVLVNLNFTDKENNLRIIVEDTGPGFPREILESHFRPYATTKKGGSGLGLAICARIVYDHGGAIKLYNREQGGGGIEIDLPA